MKPEVQSSDPTPPGLAAQTTRPRTEVHGAAASPDSLRILVVEDEPTLRTVISQVLRMEGHDVTAAGSAEEALSLFRACPFPFVITDVIMPGQSGLDLLREIKALQPEALVVIMTSHASIETATCALREGAYDFLLKPFDDLFMVSAVAGRARDRILLEARNHLLTLQLQAYAEELERLNRELRDTADRDGLTGLYNHRYFVQALDIEIARSARHNRVFSLVMLDVDHFKAYNDTHGHPAGDALLRQLAQVLGAKRRKETACARYGGEEFALILPETTRVGALTRAERIRREVEQMPVMEHEAQPTGRVTVSLGVATYPADGGDAAALIKRADAMLYEAKRKGRNRVEPQS